MLDGSIDPNVRAGVSELGSFDYFFSISVGKLVLGLGASDPLTKAVLSLQLKASV